ncbi:MAG TPA: NADH-quinone oxidoreductase subunit N [Mucilaginibacter sp.]|nr:NADH-quinone oxidoreductase subunit N [Mucilaginibacter sp.]
MNDLLPFLPGQLNQILESIPYFMPEICLSVLFILVLVTDLVFGKNSTWICKILACAGLLVVIFKDLQQFQLILSGPHFLFSEMLLLRQTSLVFKLMIDVFSVILLLYFEWDDELNSHSKGLSDLYSIAIAAIFGLHLMVMAVNLLSIYLSVEMVSIASYLMVAYRSENSFNSEAGLKYVLFGATSSAIMLYGISLLYGFGGTLNLFTGDLLPGLLQANPIAVSFAMVLFFVGVGFKLSFIPMHFWVPDIYQGAPTPVTAFLSTVSKIAAFGLLINFLAPIIYYPKKIAFDIGLFLSVIGIVTMIAGNFAATLQTNIKRMLAYSSIGHTGFALMAVIVFNNSGNTAALSALTFYLFAYALANTGALMLASYFANTAKAEDLNSYKGLGLKYPVAGVAFVVILISLTGLPITAGFNGKLLVFSSVYSVYQQSHDIWLLLLMITGAVTTVVSLFYYIKIPLNLFLRKPEKAVEFPISSAYLLIVSAIIALLLIYFGISPGILGKFI